MRPVIIQIIRSRADLGICHLDVQMRIQKWQACHVQLILWCWAYCQYWKLIKDDFTIIAPVRKLSECDNNNITCIIEIASMYATNGDYCLKLLYSATQNPTFAYMHQKGFLRSQMNIKGVALHCIMLCFIIWCQSKPPRCSKAQYSRTEARFCVRQVAFNPDFSIYSHWKGEKIFRWVCDEKRFWMADHTNCYSDILRALSYLQYI